MVRGFALLSTQWHCLLGNQKHQREQGTIMRQWIPVLPAYGVASVVGGVFGLIFVALFDASPSDGFANVVNLFRPRTFLRDFWGAIQITAVYSAAPFVAAILWLKLTRQTHWLIYMLAGGAVAFAALIILEPDLSLMMLALPLVPAGFIAGLAYRAAELPLLKLVGVTPSPAARSGLAPEPASGPAQTSPDGSKEQ